MGGPDGANHRRGFGPPLLSSPGELLELIFQRRIGDGSSIVGDRRGRDYGDDLQDLFLGEAGGKECIEFLFAQVPRFSMSVFAKVESPPNRCSLGSAEHGSRRSLQNSLPL